MRLERFTEKAQDAFHIAQEIMQEHQHSQLDVEHVFLALLRQREGITARALARLNIDPGDVARRVERELEKLPRIHGQYGMGNQVYVTPRTQRLVKRAEEEAALLGDQFIGIDHLLLGLVSERESASARILQSFGIDLERLRGILTDMRGTQRVDDFCDAA